MTLRVGVPDEDIAGRDGATIADLGGEAVDRRLGNAVAEPEVLLAASFALAGLAVVLADDGAAVACDQVVDLR